MNSAPNRGEAASVWDLPISQQLGPVEYNISAAAHSRHCAMLDVHYPWFETHGNLFPWHLCGWSRAAARYFRELTRTVQTNFNYEFSAPGKVGQSLLTTWTPVEIYTKKDYKYLVATMETRDKKGDLLLATSSEVTDVTGRASADPETSRSRRWASWDEMGEMVTASRELPEGLALLTRTKGPLPAALTGFSRQAAATDKNQDPSLEERSAREIGFRSIAVEGPVAWEFVIMGTLMDFFGPESLFTSGKVSVNIISAAYVGDVLVGKARIRDKIKEDRGLRIVLETRVEKLDGQLVNAGTASAIVD